MKKIYLISVLFLFLVDRSDSIPNDSTQLEIDTAREQYESFLFPGLRKPFGGKVRSLISAGNSMTIMGVV